VRSSLTVAPQIASSAKPRNRVATKMTVAAGVACIAPLASCLRCGCLSFRRLTRYSDVCRRFPIAAPSERSVSTSASKLKEDKISVTLVDYNGTKEQTATGPENSSLLELITDNDLDFPGYGSCSGTLSCASCHVILSQGDYERFEEACPVGIEENDMLDIAAGLSDTSRLGCQLRISKKLSGLKIKVGPEESSELQAAAAAATAKTNSSN